MKIPESLTQFYEQLWVKSHFWVSAQDVDRWVAATGFTFVLAIGRSGTAFLADLLSKIPHMQIEHEPVTLDYKAYKQTYRSPAHAFQYLQNFRLKEIFIRVNHLHVTSYGEVNSLLRRHAQALQSTIPKARLIHLVRDGRDVVRSMMNRKTFTSRDSHTRGIQPLEGDPWKDEWPAMDRFARLCWYWRTENAYLLKNVPQCVKFESLISDYNYFDQHLLQPLGMQLPQAVWADSVHTPQNISKNYRMPKWEEWSKEQKHTFMSICGEEMRAFGYNLD